MRLHDPFYLNIARLICHAHNARGELADHIHQVVLGGDDLIDRFVRLRRLVDAAAKQANQEFQALLDSEPK